MKRILFICTGNCARSVMAEVCFKALQKEAGLAHEVESAGTDVAPGLKPTELTLELFRQKKLEANDRGARTLTEKMLREADYVFVMEEKHREHALKLTPECEPKIFLLNEFHPALPAFLKGVGIPDPLGMSGTFYENVYEVIAAACAGILVRFGDELGYKKRNGTA